MQQEAVKVLQHINPGRKGTAIHAVCNCAIKPKTTSLSALFKSFCSSSSDKIMDDKNHPEQEDTKGDSKPEEAEWCCHPHKCKLEHMQHTILEAHLRTNNHGLHTTCGTALFHPEGPSQKV